MNSDTPLPAAPPPFSSPASPFKEDAVVHAIVAPARRRILLALLKGKPLSSAQLASVCRRDPDLTRKHLIVLRDLGMVVSSQDKHQDGRRQLYELSPRIRAIADPERGELDFGFCLFRLNR